MSNLTRNEIIELRAIPLTKGQEAIVDAADYELLSQWKWHAIAAMQKAETVGEK